jgi:hypothetical protein
LQQTADGSYIGPTSGPRYLDLIIAVKRAYHRQVVSRHHPDKAGSSKEAFQRLLQEAYQTLLVKKIESEGGGLGYIGV